MLAKGALRRLAQRTLEPTPENYARAYAEEAGQPLPPAAAANGAEQAEALKKELKAQGVAWVALLDRVAVNLDRGGKQWTAARRKESLQRVLGGSRSDPARLLQRLQSLVGAWESDAAQDPTLADDVATGEGASAGDTGPAGDGIAAPAADGAAPATPHAATTAAAEPGAADWPPLVDHLQRTVRAGLPAEEPRAADLAQQLGTLADAIAAEGISAERVAAVDAVCRQARRLFAHRHHLVEALGRLCRELGDGLTELAEDDSWARGQAQALQARLADGISVRAVRAAAVLLAEARQQQQRLRDERVAAREALKQLLADMLAEVGELGEHTGRFHVATERHAEAIANADTLQGLAGVVQALLADTRAVQQAVAASQQRLLADQSRASELEARVRELEGELRRLSDEVSTDALTQVANRRGLHQAFEAEAARVERAAAADEATGLAVGLIDIDNFKKLNDTLGHAAGDQALKALAAAVRERLRPVDHLARFGGEEFVVLLPATPVAEAQQALTRLQRALTEALFLHDGREVFVTFSAGVTAWRRGEPLQSALERADEALYEAKRTGKNRTCIA
jgi:diguanylate cyclase